MVPCFCWSEDSTKPSRCGGGPANHKAHRELNTLLVKNVLTAPEAGPLFREDEIRVEPRNHRPDDESKPADFDHSDLAHPGQLVLGDPACVSAVCDTNLDGSARSVAYAAAQEERNKFKRNEDSSLDVRQKGDRLIPLVMSEHGAMGAHFKAYLEELATLAVNKPGGVQSMRGTFAVSKYVSKAMLVRRWTARIVWGMQRQAAAQILATWRANAFLILGHALNLRQLVGVPRYWRCCPPCCSCSWYEYGSRDFAGRFGLDFSMAVVVAVPFILYLVRFCSSKSCKQWPATRTRTSTALRYCTIQYSTG